MTRSDIPADPAAIRLLDAIRAHVPFDGWSDAAFRAAARDAGIPLPEARALVPKGAAGLAALLHRQGDAQASHAIREADFAAMKYSDRVAHALKLRLDAMPGREEVRRSTALFALPQHAGEGAALIWGTADTIWSALGDTSDDVNWYSKRATLSAVWSSTVLYWLGDDSPGAAETRAFIDRRIAGVMQIEGAKAKARNSALLRPVTGALGLLTRNIRAPRQPGGLPGRWT
ncbi:COQ9 family protein [Pseudoroseicyclus aestuarii]|uniref:Ubiquinone biosynthesis protein COQ9 n=1 Tax=Pseudoroseicyclus aestuarii TaxID=1795041 RepID=A0A318T3E0_9RHOB|nr:COQ9 family protein [Pseudoroseicyclus aestuarii]PYE84724.1 ubiquinone biosynthesis protein COQ9 [Pseudoroseicyclus aestuarii]